MRALVIALVLALAPGCSAIASRDPGPVPCDPQDPTMDPCPAPSHCVDHFCDASCTHPGPEICNGVDDDCNGSIDDMLDVDADGDGYSACNTTDLAQSDCNDRDPAVHPGATEICDGFDDDCNPTTSDLSAPCPSGTLCTVPTGEALPRCLDPRDCTLVPCGSNQICNDDSTCCVLGAAGCGVPTDCRSMACGTGLRCTPPAVTSSMVWTCEPLTALGGNCMADRDCASGHCYPMESLGLGSGSMCGAPCCTDGDCPSAGSVCYAPGTGARSCVLLTALGAAGHDYELCTTDAACTDTCVDGAIQTPGGGARGFVCGAGSSNECTDGACPPNVCLGNEFLNYCAYPCGSDHDCTHGLGNACRYVADGGSFLSMCAVITSGAHQGESCSADRDCLDGLCLAGTCADTCCHDATCGGAATCSPIPHSGWEMRCVARTGT